MKRILTLLLVTFALTACAQIQNAPPTGSKDYGSKTFISPDGMLWYGTNPLKYRGVYPKTKVDSLLALIAPFDSSLYYTKVASDARFYPLSTNPAGYLTSFTEVDPTVPAYAKSLTAFSVIKTSTDALYPTLTGGGASGTWNINVLGNAETVTNGVYSTGSYANPSWITSLAYSKLTGAPDLSGYVDLTTDQEIDGNKSFVKDLTVNGLTIGKGAGSDFSTAIGVGALGSATEDNTAVGYFSGLNITTGEFNTALGFRTLTGITTTSENTAVGHTALRDATTGDRNTAIGHRAIYDIVNPGSDITVVGSYTTLANTPLSNASAFGAEANVGESNKVQLGNTDVSKLGIGTTTFTGTNGTAKSFALPVIGGTMAISVNGNTPDANGNVTIAVGGSGTVTSVTSADANISVATTTTTPVLTLASTISSNTSGNAATVTNGLYSTGSYADPSWLTSLAYGKITGTPDLSGYELLSNKSTSTSLGTSNTLYPTQNAVKAYVDAVAATIPTNYVNTTGNQTGILGTKSWNGNQTHIAGTNSLWGDFASDFTSIQTGQMQITNPGLGKSIIMSASWLKFQSGPGVNGQIVGPVAGSGLEWALPSSSGTVALTSQFASGSGNVSIAGFTTNITTSTALEETWIRVTDPTTNTSIVTVHGCMLVTPTATGAIEIAVNPPVSTTFTNEDNMSGTVGSTAISNGIVSASTLNDNVRIQATATSSGSSITLSYTYSYKIR